MTGLNITVARVPFPTWFCPGAAQSSTEAAQTGFSESVEELMEGVERCHRELGGVPRQHRNG